MLESGATTRRLTGPEPKTVEVRSIDYIPRAERHGRAWHVVPVWVAGNANIGSITLGFVGIGLGSNLIWTILAIVAGSAFGTLFAALHATQGPHLGLPQLIQSRPQFGYAGAVVVLLLALFTYVGFSVFTNIIAAQSLQHTVHLDPEVAYCLVGVVAGSVAFAGYHSIHVMFRWITVFFIAMFAILTFAAPFQVGLGSGAFQLDEFVLTPFLVQFSVVAGYQITWAIYVSDYSRYLPADISRRRMFWMTYLGMNLSAMWLPGLGAILAVETAVGDPVSSVLGLGDSIAPGLGNLAVLIGLGGIFGSLIMNTYGGSLTLLSIADSVHRFAPNVGHRALAVAGMVLATIALTYPAASDFRGNLTTFLQLLLYLFAPWTAINLADFFLVRRGVYSINEIFNRNGLYGRINVTGMTSYLLGFAATVPFMATSLYVGPFAAQWDGIDVAPFVGLTVAGAAYLVSNRRFDAHAESALVLQLDAGLDPGPTPTA